VTEQVAARSSAYLAEDVALVDVLDRVLTGGVVISGDVVIALAGIDLVRVSLRALVSSVDTLERVKKS
jgi:hypothetical protein